MVVYSCYKLVSPEHVIICQSHLQKCAFKNKKCRSNSLL